jgi:hypothetical protein
MLCLAGGKWASQIAQVFRKMLHTHLVEVLASLFVWCDNETKHFFDFQLLKTANSAAARIPGAQTRKIPEQF